MNITCHSNQLFAHRILNSSQVRVSIFPGFVLNNIQPPNKDISQFSPYPYPRCLQQARYMSYCNQSYSILSKFFLLFHAGWDKRELGDSFKALVEG